MEVLKSLNPAGIYSIGKSHPRRILLAVGIGFGAKLFVNKTSNRFASTDVKKFPSDTVILHQFVRGTAAPSISPFPMKVETYLRINKIPYQNDFKKPLGPKGKSPWITYNDEIVSDSQFIVEYLNKKFSINMDSHLTEVEISTAKAFRHMFEDHLYWTAVYFRWVHNNGQAVWDLTGWPRTIKGRLMFVVARWRLYNQCWAQGLGRHTPEQITKIGHEDIKAFSSFLGSKPYLMGDKICEADLVIFGFITQMIYHPHGMEELSQKVVKEFPNITEYQERIKTEYWPDWEQCIKRKKRKS